MAIVVVGGHTRNIGKTNVVAGLIAAMPEMRWTAMKITQFGHGVCSANGEACDCETADHTIAISEERVANGTDSGRYLGAGAVRSLWVRTRQGQLAEAMPRVRREIAGAENVIIESNSVLRFLRPDVFVTVLDAGVADFKESAKRYLDRADAVVVTGGRLREAAWEGVSLRQLTKALCLAVDTMEYCPVALVEFVRGKIEGVGKQTGEPEGPGASGREARPGEL